MASKPETTDRLMNASGDFYLKNPPEYVIIGAGKPSRAFYHKICIFLSSKRMTEGYTAAEDVRTH